MKDSIEDRAHREVIACLSAYGPTSFDALRQYVMWNLMCESREFAEALIDLLQVEVVVLDPAVQTLSSPEPDVLYSLDSAGRELYLYLADLRATAHDLSCGDIMLLVIRVCGMCTKQQLYRRMTFVGADRHFSQLHFSIMLWALVRREKLQVRCHTGVAPLYDLTPRGRVRLRSLTQRTNPTDNISMGE